MKLTSFVARLVAATGLVATAVVVGASGTAAAAGWPVVGSASYVMIGVPSHVDVDGTISFTLRFTEHSKYAVYVSDFSFGMWSYRNAGTKQTVGTSVTWRNPMTGSWQKPFNVGPSGSWILEPDPGPGHLGVLVHANSSIDIPVRLHMGTALHTGTYHMNSWGVDYAVADKDGNTMPATLDLPDSKIQTFSYGTGSSHPTSTPTTHPATKSTPKPAAPAAKPTPAASTAAVAPVFVTPTTTPTTTAATIAVVNAADTSSTGSSTTLGWSVAALLALAGGFASVMLVRRRVPAPVEAPTETDAGGQGMLGD